MLHPPSCFFFFFNDPATTEIYTLSLHDALPISSGASRKADRVAFAQLALAVRRAQGRGAADDDEPLLVRVVKRSEEHTSELQSPDHLVCRLLLEKKKKDTKSARIYCD